MLTLTERELALPFRYGLKKENSGLALRIRWRVLGQGERYPMNFGGTYRSPFAAPTWLNKEKLTALGFDTELAADSPDAGQYYRRQLPREVFLVLEYDGESYKKAVSRAEAHLKEQEERLLAKPDGKGLIKQVERAEESLAAERISASRLFVIDAGIDADRLRQQYANRTTHAIVKGSVRIQVQGRKKEATIVGRVSQVSIDSVNLPKHLRGPVDIIVEKDEKRHDNTRAPRYSVTVNYGQRLEPWLTELKGG